MKSIRDFIRSKIRRAEVEQELWLETAAPDVGLGDIEGTLSSKVGRLSFFTRGLELQDGTRITYEEIERVESSLSKDDRGDDCVTLKLILSSGVAKAIKASPAGGLVVHDTLRWIGHVRLRRKIAD